MWEETEISLGKVSLRSKRRIIFQRKAEDKREIVRLLASCGCSVPRYDKAKRQVVVTFKPNPFPVHLKGHSSYGTFKTITVVFKDGTKDILKFTATVTK